MGVWVRVGVMWCEGGSLKELIDNLSISGKKAINKLSDSVSSDSSHSLKSDIISPRNHSTILSVVLTKRVKKFAPARRF